MAEAVSNARGATAVGARPYLRWYRASAIGVSLVFLIFAAWAAWRNHFWPKWTDYVSFWAAGRLTLAGTPSLAYDISAHHAAEQAAGHVAILLPFPYPPPFLALVSPFALLPYGPSFYIWIAATAGFYAWAARRYVPGAYVFANPSAYINFLGGQTGFLTSGVIIKGLALIDDNPWSAGAILGLMLVKPQLALLLPIAMLAGREWRVIGGAILSASALLLVAAVLLGWSSYQAFFGILPHYVGFMRDAFWPWNLLASPFALARFVGLSQTAAFSVHVAIAIVAVLITARAWWLRLDTRVPILLAATPLVPPYVLTYDTVLLIVPMLWLIRDGRHPAAAAAAWLCCLFPVLNHFTPFSWPNLIPVAAVLCLGMLYRDSTSLPRDREPLSADRRQISPAL